MKKLFANQLHSGTIAPNRK